MRSTRRHSGPDMGSEILAIENYMSKLPNQQDGGSQRALYQNPRELLTFDCQGFKSVNQMGLQNVRPLKAP